VVECLALTFFIAGDAAIDARDTPARPDDTGNMGVGEVGGCDDEGSSVDDRSSPAANKRTPSLIAVLAVGIIDDTAVAGMVPAGTEDASSGELEDEEYARSMPRLIIRSHFRLS